MVNLTHPELAEIQTPSLPGASLDALYALRTKLCNSAGKEYTLQPLQRLLRRILSPDSPTRNLLMVHGTGVGKCHGKGSPILMHDGSVKLVEDVAVGDLLMGDDSTPRTVESLARGCDQMYRVTSTKGESYVVNSEHILCLQHTSFRNVVTEITVTDFLKASAKLRRDLKGYRTAVDFAPQRIDFDPYILGLWLGDGSQRDPVICSQDAVILHYLRDFCHRNNSVLTFQSGYDYRITAISKKHENVFLSFLKTHDLINNKHVPDEFKINSREVRLQVLAGLIDTDGYLSNGVYEITQKSKQISDDIIFIARSLGLATTTRIVEKSCVYNGQRVFGHYYRTNICGDIDMIPVKLFRKKAAPRRQIKDVLRYGITVTPIGEGDYYGFMIDGNHRYVLGDFTVTHNTCTGIQIAEEYILRPEFQDKKVLVVASRAVQENFRTQIFDMSRVYLDKASDTLSSKQCTGRRYLDMLLRIESEPKNWADPEIKARLEKTSDRIINEFYEFQPYTTFGLNIERKLTGTEADIDETWVHENFDNRLIIIDEAHNITTEETSVAANLERLVKVADGLVLVLLTATPMYDTFEEIVFFMNLFLWNERKQPFETRLKASDFFTSDGDLKDGEAGKKFREWCQDYVSYAKGESPFTFPFRLPPPVVADTTALSLGFNNVKIPEAHRIKYLSLVASQPAGEQLKILTAGTHEVDDGKRAAMMAPTLSVFPANKKFNDVFKATKIPKETKYQYEYKSDIKFLNADNLANYSSKFVSVINSIQNSSGVCLVYSNYVERGARLFAMALEEHGYTPHKGKTLFKKTSYGGQPKGKYILISSEATDVEINVMLDAVKNRSNVHGEKVKVVITSPLAAEGIDFRFIRQVHILDPWWNMSRIEQVVGRALRTCSHQDLPSEEQNCTVYFHVVRPEADREAFDEYTYRVRVEAKGIRIAKVRKIIAESAMDCPIQLALPADWRELEVPQIRDEGHERVVYRLKGMMAPAFDEAPDVEQCKVTQPVPDPDHVRPLSTYLDSRDEILTKIGKLFIDKSIWDRKQLISALRPFSHDVVVYTLQQAISTSFRFTDSFGRASLLESKGDMYALAPVDVPNSTLVERTTRPAKHTEIDLPEPEAEPEAPAELEEDALTKRRIEFKWPKLKGASGDRFSDEVKNGFIFDHKFSAAEKRLYLATNPDLPFLDRLRVPDSDIIVTGDETQRKDLVGEDRTKYDAWASALRERFIADKKKLFASVASNGVLTLSPSKMVDDVPVRAIGVKSFAPTVSRTGANVVPVMKVVAKYIDKNGVGSGGLGGTDLDIYAELLAREQHNIVWYTPEELKVLLAPENKNIVMAGLLKA